MRGVTNREARKALFWGLAVFVVLLLYGLLCYRIEAIINNYIRWLKGPEGWSIRNIALFWTVLRRLFYMGTMIPLGFCLSLGFRFKGMKDRFCLNWGWLALLAMAIVFFVGSFYLLQLPFFSAQVSLALSYGPVIAVLLGLFIGHCLRAGLFAGKGE